jgi:hypothetical protein
MPRPSKQAEKIHEDIMGQPRNVSRKINIRQPKQVNGDMYNQNDTSVSVNPFGIDNEQNQSKNPHR